MKYLAIILLFSSCAVVRQAKDYKAYQRVAGDPFVDQREMVLLSQKCKVIFPLALDSGRIISETIDTAAHNAIVNAYIEALDTAIANINAAGELPLFAEEDSVVVVVRTVDSLRVIRNFLRKYRPPPITKEIVKEVLVRDGVWEQQKIFELQACSSEKVQLVADNERLSNKLANRNSLTGWLIGGGLLLALITFGVGRVLR